MTKNAGATLRRFSLCSPSPSLHIGGTARLPSPVTVPIEEAEMYFRSMEDRLNPIAPAEAEESTLGGYIAIHGRSPGFTGSDGMPYTAAIEVEPPDDEEPGWIGYLVFLRWAENSTAIMGHLDSGDLVSAPTEKEARQIVADLSLNEVKRLLDECIDRPQRSDEPEES